MASLSIDWNAVAREWSATDAESSSSSASSASSPAATLAARGAAKDDGGEDATTKAYFEHSSAARVNTDMVIAKALREQYPGLELVVTPAFSCNLLAYARAGHAECEPVDEAPGGGGGGTLPASLQWDVYVPPARRLDGAIGGLGAQTLFGKFLYRWRGADMIVYLVSGRDGTASYPTVENYYVLTRDRARAHELLLAVGRWGSDLHDEVWVYDQGYWQKNAELYRSIMQAEWANVILAPAMKRALIDDHLSFFAARDTYARLKVPWKRGVIYHGPPGNGKTISIKATMHMLYDLKTSVPTLYVRSLSSYQGPEYSIKQVFGKAREFAPCYLVFEDLDSLINDSVRSYFLNEVDGLKSNDGIFMVGSTNHLDRLDPGISKRPSRFDRKYFFPDPNLEERVAYCHFWQTKLADNKDIDFPDALCDAIAEITDKFSFAYIQEAFVAALLALAQKERRSSWSSEESLTEELGDGWVGVLGGGDELDKLKLWVEIKKQIAILREGMDGKAGEKGE